MIVECYYFIVEYYQELFEDKRWLVDILYILLQEDFVIFLCCLLE